MPLDHQNVTARISVAGLALGCYNASTSKWEVCFLRHPLHSLTIEVTSMTANGPSRSRFEIDQHHSIFVDAENAIVPEQALFMEGQFDRQGQENDPEDLRWIVDIERELNNNQEVTLRRPDFPVTEMQVSHPVLYADKHGFAIDSLKLVNADNGSDVRLFGRLAEVVQADIRCQEEGAVIFKVEGPLGFSIRLPHVPGRTHTVVMDNTCRNVVTPSSDFTIYYSMVQSTSGDRFDFRRENDDASSPDAVCNHGYLGVRDSLFPLP